MCGKGLLSIWTQAPHRRFITIPLGPVIQALYGSPGQHTRCIIVMSNGRLLEYAERMGGRSGSTMTLLRRDYLEAAKEGQSRIMMILVQLSLDGDQLYRDKTLTVGFFVYSSTPAS